MSTLLPTHTPATSDEELQAVMQARRLRDVALWQLGLPGRILAVSRRDGSLAAGALAVCATLVALCHPERHADLLRDATAWFGLLRVVALVWPVRLVQRRYAVELTLDSSLLAYWLLTEPPPRMVLMWLAASAVAELLRSHVLSLAAVNCAISTLSCVAAVGTFAAVGDDGLAAGGLVGVLTASAVYVLVDHLLSRLVVALLGERLTAEALLAPGLWMCLAVSVALASPGWAMSRLEEPGPLGGVILCCTTLTMIVLMSFVTSMAEDRQRLRIIVGYLHRIHTFADTTAALDALQGAGSAVLGAADVAVRSWPPVPARREIGFLIEGGTRTSAVPERWLVASPRVGDSGYHPGEVAAFEALARVGRDALALRRTSLETEWLATHDVLTGLANRTRLLDALLAAEREQGPTRTMPAAVILLDIDGFKAVNDADGHEAGDTVLSVLGPRIVGCVPEDVVAARLGGDEFACYLPTVSSVDEVRALCETIRARCREPIPSGDRLLRLDASVGFAVGPRREASVLLRRADEAMYLIKHSGKGGVAQHLCAAEQADPPRTAATYLVRTAATLPRASVDTSLPRASVDAAPGRAAG